MCTQRETGIAPILPPRRSGRAVLARFNPLTDEKKTARARKSPATIGAAAKKTTPRKKSATASLAEARFSPAKKAPARKSAAKKPASRKSAAGDSAAKKSFQSTAAAAKPAARKLLRPDVATSRRKSTSADSDAYELLQATVVRALDSLKAKDVVALDVRNKTSMTDLIVIASGTSSRHVKSLADEVVKAAKKIGQPPLGVEGSREAEWVLVDLGDAIVHVMLPRSREFYGLERLWTVGDPEPADAFDNEVRLGD